MKLFFVLLAALFIAGILASGFHPAPDKRILFDNDHYQVLEDPQTNMVCTIDKTGTTLPVCHPIRQQEHPNYDPTYDPSYPTYPPTQNTNTHPDNPDEETNCTPSPCP